ncbi:Snf1 kinase complex beta-subunit Gal83 [Histoplasma capsulatum H143]|uniref:Snf1 kinase complex beta-subunit Gal83 n=1 Tax=Ajellomyces capsulatus (strain H143) TaxID=544712 RepID=C6HHW1_AJECH|nr:Snf1 kinase complex beta-subunit Gal83 [Histoplasma capsulatum H143]
MGASPSKQTPPGGDSINTTYPATTGSHQNTYNDRRVNRCTSIHALSGTTGTGSKSSAADPSASRESATGHPIPHRQQAPVQHWLQSRNLPDSPRHDSHQHQQLRHRDSKRHQRENSDKREYLPARSQGDPSQAPTKAVPVSSPPDRGQGVASNTGVVTNVVARHHTDGHHEQYTSIEPSGPTPSAYYGASAHLSRPPRLPLPIDDAMTAPGSPIVAPSSMTGPHAAVPVLVDKAELELPGSGEGRDRAGAAGLGEEEEEEEEIIDELEVDAGMGVGVGGVGVNKAVTTTIEWRGGGEKVYVTGTFVNWERKFRLHKSETEDSVQAATLQLRPGTHHLKFIVDGIMSTSDQLPTASAQSPKSSPALAANPIATGLQNTPYLLASTHPSAPETLEIHPDTTQTRLRI